jgi:DNA repair protein RadC
MGVRAADPLRLALRAAASGFVLVHNHPSGDPTPSAEDVTFTRRVADAASVVGVPLLDHVVVAREGFASVPFAAEAPALLAGGVEA